MITEGGLFGRWTVVGRCADKPRYYNCRCACGTERPVFGSTLINGKSTSCGCWSVELSVTRSTTHGHARPGLDRSREYNVWARMISRCENKREPQYKNYGGRGIAVCARWRSSFSAFLADVGPHPGAGWSIDRIDVNGHYVPGNVRWATAREQANNRRSNVKVTIDGRELTLAECARLAGVSPATIKRRLDSGVSVEQLLLPAQRPHHWSH